MTGSQESTPNNSPHLGIGIINIVNSSVRALFCAPYHCCDAPFGAGNVMQFAEYFAAWTPDDANAAHIHGFAEPGKTWNVVNLFCSSSNRILCRRRRWRPR
jgi:hypothetical protein